VSHVLTHLDASIEALEAAQAPAKEAHRTRLLSQVDVLTDHREGMDDLLERIPTIVSAGVFDGGPWEDVSRLVPALVGGTLRAGGATTLLEILSELRLVAIAEGTLLVPDFSDAQARAVLKEILVNTLDLLFPAPTEEDRNMDPAIRTKVDHLMALLLERIPLEDLREALATEIELICRQRPVVTDRAIRIIGLVRANVSATDGSDDPAQRKLDLYAEAVFAPSLAAGTRSVSEYGDFLLEADRPTLEAECHALGSRMRETGLAVAQHALMLRRVISIGPDLTSILLDLDESGQTELGKHLAFVERLVQDVIHADTARSVYGLGQLLERGLLSRQPVLSGLERLSSLKLHPEVDQQIRLSRPDSTLSARQLLLADCLGVLGQPLGVAQGNNPTCQSARGISLWSRHAPGKLTDMIRTVAATHKLAMRFEGHLIDSTVIGEGLVKAFDHDLDAVSVLLVPHLDRIYNDMMQRASYRGDDPHKWVNPAMYGHWIPTGFLSAYDYGTGTIRNYAPFLRTFYATHHPDFNRGHDLAYPNPVGVFVTASSGVLIGFHAVSILRVRRVGDEIRVYFFNPNNEGRQRWYADIRPTVAGHGERPGESSLPFDQFASRLYAFHFNPSDVGTLEAVDDARLAQVTEAARESWGKSYEWSDVIPSSLPAQPA
jgi:hypothetical protein